MANPNTRTVSTAASIATLWRSLVRDLFDGYRPELHYMRGPGPKWRAKHEVRSASPEPAIAGLSGASA
jgi:hypothetical protein